MILWTFQHEKAYETLLQQGVLRANEDYLFSLEGFKEAYDWLVEQMKERIGQPPEEVRYPIWAWYKIDNKRKKPDLRLSEFHFADPQVLLEIEIPDGDVLLSDEENWHFVLNNWYYSSAETMAAWEKEDEWFNSLPEGAEKETIRRKSWDAIFDTDFVSNEVGTQGRYIQATFWELRLDQVKSVKTVKGKAAHRSKKVG